MKLQPREIRALALLPVGVIVVLLVRWISSPSPPAPAVSSQPADLLERRLNQVRQLGATVPARERALRVVRDQLAVREKSILQFSTAPQAQAHLLEVVRRIASANKIEARGGDFAPPRPLGDDYGEVAVSINFECPIDPFMNFLADLSRETELISPSELHISAANQKNKTINVRMVLSGVVPKKLVPEKKATLL